MIFSFSYVKITIAYKARKEINKVVAEVIINSSAKRLNRTFDYNIPKELEDLVVVGSTVLVQFANYKELEEAYVIKIKESSEFNLKSIVKLKDNLTDFQIKLAKWMAKKYYCNVSECIKLMLTPGTKNKNQEKNIKEKKVNVVYLKKELEEIEFDIEKGLIKSDKQIRLLNFLKENEGCTITDIELFTDCSRAIVKTLEKNGYIEIVEKKIERNPLADKDIEKTDKLSLTEEQQSAFDKISKSIQESRFEEFLLYGVTGSRKDRSIFTIN